MRTILELEEALQNLITTSRAIVDKAKGEDERALTSEEKGELTSYQKDIAAIEGEIADRRALDAADQMTAVQMDSLNPTRRTIPSDPNNAGEPPKPNVVPFQRRVGKLKAFKGAHAERDAYRSGQFIRAALFNHDRANRWCRENGIDVRAMSVGVNTAGGFTVPEEMATAIIDLREEYGVFRRECEVVPMNRDIMTIPRVAGAGTAVFVGENTALTESETTWNQVNLTAHKAGRLVRMSSEIAEDSIINMADMLAKHFAYSFALLEDQTGFIGDGTATYAGIRGLTIKIVDGTHTACAHEAAATHDLFSELDVPDLTSTMGLCAAYAHNGAKWYTSQLGYDSVFGRLSAVAGGSTIQDMAGAFGPSFLGYPIVVSQQLPRVSTTLDTELMLLFGNLGMAATLGDRRQFTMALSTDRYFVEDQVAIRATERFDINVHDLGDNTTAGPMSYVYGNIA